jgi:hypothetical protein
MQQAKENDHFNTMFLDGEAGCVVLALAAVVVWCRPNSAS